MKTITLTFSLAAIALLSCEKDRIPPVEIKTKTIEVDSPGKTVKPIQKPGVFYPYVGYIAPGDDNC